MMTERMSSLSQRVEKIINGQFKLVDLPWPIISKATQALFPGSVTLFVGSGGTSKSLMVLQCLLEWHLNGIKACIYQFEEDKDYHLLRTLAQYSGEAGMTELKWIADHPDEAREILSVSQNMVTEFSENLWMSPLRLPTLPQISDWIEARASEKYRVICVDPVTKAQVGRDRSSCENEFLQHAVRMAATYGCSIILVTHPKQTYKGISLAALAGSAVYERFSQTIIWLESHKFRNHRVEDKKHGTFDIEHNRTISILKARNGRDECKGWKIALNFDTTDLKTEELGIIIKK